MTQIMHVKISVFVVFVAVSWNSSSWNDCVMLAFNVRAYKLRHRPKANLSYEVLVCEVVCLICCAVLRKV